MNHLLTKGAVAAALVAAVGLAATPSEARCRGCGAAAAGFAAGAIVGAAATSSYYGPGYYYGGPGYYDGPAYYGGPYAYEPAPVYSEPAYAAAPVYRSGSCWHVTDDARGYGYYGSCATPQTRPGARTTSNSAQ
jgi:hypothetical protein